MFWFARPTSILVLTLSIMMRINFLKRKFTIIVSIVSIVIIVNIISIVIIVISYKTKESNFF